MDLNRKTAYEVLFDIEKNGAYSNISLNNFIEKNEPDNPAFVRELVYGVVKNKILLDFVLKIFVAKGFSKLKPNDLSLLRMGAYQLLFMNSVPEYAAVSETVELAKKFSKGKERFINAVLRNLIRERSNIKFPNSEDDPYKYLSVTYSCEPWIVELWMNAFGYQTTKEILAASMETPDLSIRVNLEKSSKKELTDELTELGFTVWDTQLSDRALLVKGSGLLDTKAFKEGRFSVQDVSSIVCSDILSEDTEAEAELVIDCCACPGGKTFATAEILRNSSIIAMDVYENKLSMMKEEALRTGHQNIKFIQNDATKSRPELHEKASRVICDVPCSGLGVLRRKPEIKYKEEYDIASLVSKQSKILHAAAHYVKRGGVIVYSTCTINPQENQNQVKNFVSDNPEYEIEKEVQLLPTMGVDGFYIAKLRRKNGSRI